MNHGFKVLPLVLLFSSLCFAQEPVPVLRAKWERVTVKAPKTEVAPTGPNVSVIAENKYFQRKAREQRTDHPPDPTEETIEGRSRALDKIVQESRTPQPDDQTGYSYLAEVRNDTGKKIAVLFWEYRFTEIARPTNVVRRQFLCGVEIKDGDKKSLSAFSLLGPSDSIDSKSLEKPDEKLFDEKVQINRIEFSDGEVRQRNGWKFEDVREAVDRATATPWGKDTCRPL